VTAIGLVVAELVTNSYGHAFPDGRSGTITVALTALPASSRATLTVKDNGIGFISDAGSKRYGLGLVRRLVETVDGTITHSSGLGTEWAITFGTLGETIGASTVTQS
jgi:two-component sensor histidine kinase